MSTFVTKCRPEGHGQFIAAYKSGANHLEATEHCLGYEMSQGVEERNNFTVRIEWDSVEGHEKGFRGVHTSARSSLYLRSPPVSEEMYVTKLRCPAARRPSRV